jgi:hypothetical protein
MWRHFDCYDPWIGLYDWNAYRRHGHGTHIAPEQPRTRYLMSVMKEIFGSSMA